MWAGGSIRFHSAVHVGQTISRVSTITAVLLKKGRSGPLVFVTVRHEISNPEGLAISEYQELVYRDKGNAVRDATTRPHEPAWERQVRPDEVLLFRYSALTFNGHRIHYDRRYATEVEGYPGLVVHGPLVATLLVDLLLRNEPSATVRSFEYRSVAPLFDTAPFRVCGRPDADTHTAMLWAENEAGQVSMTATAVCHP